MEGGWPSFSPVFQPHYNCRAGRAWLPAGWPRLQGCLMRTWIIHGLRTTAKCMQPVSHLWKESSQLERRRGSSFFFALISPSFLNTASQAVHQPLSPSQNNIFKRHPQGGFKIRVIWSAFKTVFFPFLPAFQCLLKNKHKVNSNARYSSNPIKRH